MKMFYRSLQVALLATLVSTGPVLPSNDPHGIPIPAPRPNCPSCGC